MHTGAGDEASREQPIRGLNREVAVPQEGPRAIWAIIQRCTQQEADLRPDACEVVATVLAVP